MNTKIIATTLAVAVLSATSASALSYLDNFGTGIEGTEEGTERVTSETTETSKPGRGQGKGKKK